MLRLVGTKAFRRGGEIGLQRVHSLLLNGESLGEFVIVRRFAHVMNIWPRNHEIYHAGQSANLASGAFAIARTATLSTFHSFEQTGVGKVGNVALS